MSRNVLFAALMSAGAIVATTAQAEQHDVLVLGAGFFPITIYLSAGDSIRFVNESGETQYLIGDSNQWTTGAISADGNVVVVVSEGMTSQFLSTTDGTAAWDDFNGTDQPGAPQGSISFSAAPLG